MNTATRQLERQVEDAARTQAEARRRNNTGQAVRAVENAEYEDALAERMDDNMFSDLSQTGTQELLHEFGGGISHGPPKGGWPVFDPVSGKRLASPQVFTSNLSPI